MRNASSSSDALLLHSAQDGTVIKLSGRGLGKILFGGRWSEVVASLIPQIAHIFPGLQFINLFA
jgi:hypothetical protein